MGAFPVFVVDGEPPPLKAQARIERFCRATGLDPSAFAAALPRAEDGASPEIQRNRFFTKCVQECVVSRRKTPSRSLFPPKFPF